jgi:GH3 auxin-responsive promoter
MPNLRKFLHLLFIYLIGKPIAYPVRRRLYRFNDATQDPQRVQETVLRGILAYHAQTDFGREHGFDSIHTAADFRRQLPIAGYDYFEPYIARVRRGETNALLADRRVHMFALTSGTTATRKFIPVTDRYLADYKRGWNVWGLKAFRDHPDIRLRPILQISGDHEEFFTEAGIPCGAVTGLTATMQKRIIRWLYCVPACVGKIKDTTAKYYVALRLSLPRQVAIVASANPSTLLNLARLGDLEKESLIRDLSDGTLSDRFEIPPAIRTALRGRLRKHPQRARELEEIVRRTGTLYPKDYWPRKCLLGNWMGGSMGAYLRQYPRYYGTHPVRDVGLIASEGRMTIPFDDGTPAGILDVTTHYFEFIPEDEVASPQPTVLGAHELEDGGRYYILPTTAFGLYRYHIQDVVRVAGFHNRTPRLEFLSKGAYFSNLTGEKVSEYQVTQAMVEVLHELNLTLNTYSLAPCWDDEMPCYGLFVERDDLASPSAGENLVQRLDERLRNVNIEYDAKRASLRLGPIHLEQVSPGFWAEWDKKRLHRSGGGHDQYKHPCLISDTSFAAMARQTVRV